MQLKFRKGGILEKQEKVHLYPVFTKLDIPLQAVCLLLLASGIGYVINILSNISGSVPSSFSLEGAVTGYSDKFSALTYLIVAVLFYLIGWFLETHLHYLPYPCVITEENAEKFYKPMRILIIVLKTEICLYSLYMIMMIKTIAAFKKGSLLPYSTVIFIAILIITVLIGFLILKAKAKDEPKETPEIS